MRGGPSRSLTAPQGALGEGEMEIRKELRMLGYTPQHILTILSWIEKGAPVQTMQGVLPVELLDVSPIGMRADFGFCGVAGHGDFCDCDRFMPIHPPAEEGRCFYMREDATQVGALSSVEEEEEYEEYLQKDFPWLLEVEGFVLKVREHVPAPCGCPSRAAAKIVE